MCRRHGHLLAAACLGLLAVLPALAGPATAAADTDPPQTTITDAPRFITETRATWASATFRFTSDEAGSTFRCRLDDRHWRACTSPWTYQVRRGEHLFRVRATDPAGNRDPSAARWHWTVQLP